MSSNRPGGPFNPHKPTTPTHQPAPTPPPAGPGVAAGTGDTPANLVAVTSIVLAACPSYDNTGAQNDMSSHFGLLTGAIHKALAAGKSTTAVARAIISRFAAYPTTSVAPGAGGSGGNSYALAWSRGTQEFSDAELESDLGLGGKVATKRALNVDAAGAKALASNGANIAEANSGGTFNAVDGHVVRVEDADHDTQVALLNKTYPAAPDAPPAKPVDPGPGPFGSPGIG